MNLGFPWWLRVEHFLNIIFISFLIRSGIEILGTYPKLYRSQHTVAGTAWAQFTIQRAPKHKYYTVGGEYDDYSPACPCRAADCWAWGGTGTSSPSRGSSPRG